RVLKMEDITEVYKWLGLHEIPSTQPEISPNPIPTHLKDEDFTHLGVSIIEKNNARALTMSCATCHTSNLFGTTIVGLTNRFPRANDFFILGRKGLKLTNK